jgi:arsenate reductase (thioredoxin)
MSTLVDPMEHAPIEIRPLIRSVAARLREEFEGTFAVETIQRFMAESYSTFQDAKTTAFVPLFVERYTRQRLRALGRIEGTITKDVPLVVFLCVHNAGRSQMAAGWLRHLAGDAAEVFSGGSDPASEVNPAAVDSMAEAGIDISTEFPKPWTDEIVQAADVVITMGCGDACPVYPGKRYEDWELEDPAGKDIEAVRAIRDEIESRVRRLLSALVDS